MPPKVQISKERILDTALHLIIIEGYQAVTIKRLAKELGCSTQPVSWTFGNMENFRSELTAYALKYLNDKMAVVRKNPVAGFSVVGEVYINEAFDEPNLIRFIRENSSKFVDKGGIGAVFNDDKIRFLRIGLGNALGISEEMAEEFIWTVIIYTQGLVGMIVDGTVSLDRDKALDMMRHVGIVYMVYAGVPREKAEAFFE